MPVFAIALGESWERSNEGDGKINRNRRRRKKVTANPIKFPFLVGMGCALVCLGKHYFFLLSFGLVFDGKAEGRS
jgi:hypothetical protein